MIIDFLGAYTAKTHQKLLLQEVFMIFVVI